MTEICDELRHNGACYRPNCTLSHDVFTCQVCRCVCTTRAQYEEHLQSYVHTQRVRKDERRRMGLSQPVRCVVCPMDLSGAIVYRSHMLGRKHRKALDLSKYQDDPGPEEIDVTSADAGFRRCDVCQVKVETKTFAAHLASMRHSRAVQYVALKSALDESEKDKNGIVISGVEDAVDFGVLNFGPGRVQHKKVITVTSTNTTAINFVSARISSRQTSRASFANFQLKSNPKPARLTRNSSFQITISFDSRSERGRFNDRVELIFEDVVLHKRFCITRPLIAAVGILADYEALRATAPYVRPKRKRLEPIGEIVPGVAPEPIARFKWAVHLLKYEIPRELVRTLAGGTTTEIVKRVRDAFLPSGLTVPTYARFFSNLLWIEEERARLDLENYNMEGVTLRQVNHLYELEVAGLAEKRPSVIVSDIINVRESGSTEKRWFAGHVHRVLEKHVHLHFNQSFHCFPGQKFDVRFELNRLTFRRMHQGMNTAYAGKWILFPGPEDVASLQPPTLVQRGQITTVERMIMDNQPQMEAITAIVNRPRGSAPFVVFGPPGTGKTVTIVEAIRKLVTANSSNRIYACAPSNSAADLIAQRLTALGRDQLFRLNAPSRKKDTLPKTLLPYSLAEGDTFAVPGVEALKKYRVIVSTCFSASVPHGIGIPRGHFSHIFIDEAGQGTEPEIMISIKTMAGNDTNVVLSGDMKQLGPIVRSPVARELGLSTSYLDRLMANPVYDEREGHGKTVVKLIKNWRSHPDILKFPNEEFYRGDLVACAEPLVTHSLLRWDCLATPNYPIVFHSIAGKDEREASSPSFFNIEEASLVKHYVSELYGDRRLRIKPEDIGIISPYHAQVCKIRKVLKSLPGQTNAKDIKVGSVEEFQGQERRVIIISTVRSSVDMVSFDLRHTLGFVANPRRFNVAITRAKALLIIIGDPFVLSLDPLWKSFINFIHIHNGYKGKPIDWDPKEPVDRDAPLDEQRRAQGLTELDQLIARTRTEILGQSENLGGEDEMVEVNIEKPWREDE